MKPIFDCAKLSKTVFGHLVDSDLPEGRKDQLIHNLTYSSANEVKDDYLKAIGIFGFTAQIKDAFLEIDNAVISKTHKIELTTYDVKHLINMLAVARLQNRERLLRNESQHDENDLESEYEESQELSNRLEELIEKLSNRFEELIGPRNEN